MSDIEAPWLVQVSIKTTGQTLINVRAMTIEDLKERLEGIQGIADTISATEAVIGVLQPVGAHRAPPAAQPQGAPVPPPAGAGPAAAPTAPLCDHGIPAKFVPGGVSKKTNRPYKAFWVCSQDQQFQCAFRQDG